MFLAVACSHWLISENVSHLSEAYDFIRKLKKQEEPNPVVGDLTQPSVYNGHNYTIKPAYFGGYQVSIDGGEYRNMGNSHSKATSFAQDVIDGSLSYEQVQELDAEAITEGKERAEALAWEKARFEMIERGKTSLRNKVELLSAELLQLKMLLKCAATSALEDLQGQLAELGNCAEQVSELCNERLIAFDHEQVH
jgi:hypothetical protein